MTRSCTSLAAFCLAAFSFTCEYSQAGWVDDFDDGVLDPQWTVSFHENATGWTFAEAASKLEVTDIATGTSYCNDDCPAWGVVRLSRWVPDLGDFHVDFDFAWDSLDAGGQADPFDAIQTVGVYLVGGGVNFARAAYVDSWGPNGDAFGRQEASIAGVNFVGSNGLPHADSAAIDIDRAGNNVTIRWAGNTIHTGTASEDLSEVRIEFGYFDEIGANGGGDPCPDHPTCNLPADHPASTFGTLSVDRICVTPPVLFVNAAAAGANDGTSWANAFVHLQDALGLAAGCSDGVDEVWVAAGTYKPDQGVGITPGDRTASFELVSGVALYGGFDGTETQRSQRNVDSNATILSGDLAGGDDPLNPFLEVPPNWAENSYHVVTAGGLDTATLDGFTVTHGYASGAAGYESQGAAMNVNNSAVFVRNCQFTENAAFNGGALYLTSTLPDSSARLERCTFERNNAASIGGGLVQSGNVNLAVEDCAILNNWGGSIGGGAACVGGSPVFRRCLFEGNQNGNGGGGLYLHASAMVIDSTFRRNRTGQDGGGLYCVEGIHTVVNCRFESNHADDRGGGLRAPTFFNGEGVLRATNCVFVGNTADQGGAVLNLAGDPPSEQAYRNCTFANNVATSDGGGVLCAGSPTSANPTFANCIFWNNQDVGGMDESAQIHVASGAPVVNYSVVQGGWSGAGDVGVIDADPLFVRAADAGGDGWGDDPATPGIDEGANDDFGDLRPGFGSPAIDAGSNGAVPADAADLDDDANTMEPTPLDAGGEPRLVDNPCAPDCPQTPGQCGTAPVVDMGAYEHAALPPPQPIIFVDDDAAGQYNGTSWTDAFTDLQAALCAAEQSGGIIQEIRVAAGIYKPTRGTDRTASFQLVNGVALLGGFAGDEAGERVSPINEPSIQTRNSKLETRNSAGSQISSQPCGLARQQEGGVRGDPGANETILSGDLLGNDGANFTSNGENSYHVVLAGDVDETAVLYGFTITAGNADGVDPGDTLGGGVLHGTGSATIQNCAFRRNSAELGGGGMCTTFGGNPAVSNCTFEENQAGGGAGIYNKTNSSPTITGCRFIRNTAASGGGVQNQYLCNPTLINCSFRQNSANNRGGGMDSWDSCAPRLVNCTFDGNSAEYGGGLSSFNDASATLVNCTFTGNSAMIGNGWGGAFYNENGNPMLTNCTLSANYALNVGGVAINGDGVSVTVQNSILWQNTAAGGSSEGSQIGHVYQLPVNYSIDFCDIQGLTGALGGTGNIDADPRFENIPTNGPDGERGTDDDPTNLRLSDGSPAVDAGSNGAVAADIADLDCDGNLLEATPFDLDGSLRFVDSSGVDDTGMPLVDMGAYEQGPLTGARRLFVRANAAANGDGLSWATAYQNPRSALEYAAATQCGALEVWVSAGTYMPDGGHRPPGGAQVTGSGDPSESFQLLDGVVFYGGFEPGDATLAERNVDSNATILSGDLGGGQRSYHVVTATGTGPVAILDGFTITGGDAAGPPHGGGLITLAGGPTLRNCVVVGNQAECAAGLSASGIVTADGLTIGINNGGGDMGLSQGGLMLEGPLTLSTNAQLDVFGGTISGPSALQLDADSLMRVRNVSPCGAEIITHGGGALDATTIFLPVAPGPPPVPARWEIAGAPVSNMALSGPNQTWLIPSATLDWSDSFLNQDHSGGGMAEATFRGGGSFTLDGDLDGGTFTTNGVLLTAEVGPFRVRETAANSNVLEFVAGQEPVLTPTGGYLVTNTEGFVLAGPQKLTMEFAAAQPPLTNFDSSSTIALTGMSQLVLSPVNPPQAVTLVRSDISGAGDIEIEPKARLTIAGLSAVVDLSGQPPGNDCATTDPGQWGTITVNGELVVQDATVQNSNVDVALADIAGASDIVNNDLRLLESSPDFGGQFFVEGAATIQCNVITSFGDRYLDLDPDPAAAVRPTISDNLIYVFITQGTQSQQGELLELRAFDHDAAIPCPASAPCAIPLGGSDGFDDTWTLERLEIEPNAKVNLTNRQGFDFNASPIPDTLYVKDVVIGTNGVLNVGLQRLYYQNLTMGPGAQMVDIPVLGFSLKIIALEDDTEFDVRVRTRLRDPIDVQPLTPPFKQGAIERVEGLIPPGGGNGVMDMRTQAAGDCAPNPDCSATSVAAKGAFARAGEDEIVVAFEYLFVQDSNSSGVPAELVVYLSDDPDVSENLVEIARVYVPADGRDGSVPALGGTGEFATFYGRFPRGNLNFTRGTYVELELRGEDARVWIDDWDPQILCIHQCGDLNGTDGLENEDYLLLLAFVGVDLQQPPAGQGNLGCLDTVLGGDQYLDLGDLLAWDTFFPVDPNGPDPCGGGTGTRGAVSSQLSPFSSDELGTDHAPLTTHRSLFVGDLVVAGKNGAQDDALFGVDITGDCPGGSVPPADAAIRGHGRLLSDSAGTLYQLHARLGVLPVEGGPPLVTPGMKSFSGKTVHVGLTDLGGGYFVGLPITDAAFDPEDASVVYVLPVVVTTNGVADDRYKAAAKLRLAGSGSCVGPLGDYCVEQIYEPPAQYRTNLEGHPFREKDQSQLREIEVSAEGRVFIATAQAVGDDDDWLLTFLPDGTLESETLLPFKAPSAMLAARNGSTPYLYMTAAANEAPDDWGSSGCPEPLRRQRTRLFRFNVSTRMTEAIDIANQGCMESHPSCPEPFCWGCVSAITALAEAPNSTVWVAGITRPAVPGELSTDTCEYQALFGTAAAISTTPTLTEIPVTGVQWMPISSSTVQATATPIGCADLALPISMVWNASGIPAATVISAVSRRGNPHAPGVCDTNLLPARKSEPHQGGIQEVRIGFDVTPGTPSGSGVSLESATCPPPGVFGPEASPVSSSVVGNELLLTFMPPLANAKSYRITIGPQVTSIAGQTVEVRGLAGDVNGSGRVDATDRSLLVGAWTGPGSFSCPTDVNNSGVTNATDRSLVVGAWTGGAASNWAP